VWRRHATDRGGDVLELAEKDDEELVEDDAETEDEDAFLLLPLGTPLGMNSFILAAQRYFHQIFFFF
jgi:hypothetical protein